MKSVIYRRKREGRTNYNKRLQLLVSREHRIVIRKSLKAISLQVVDYLPDGDKILASAHSRELKAYGLPYANANISIAYLTGLLCGMKAKKAGIKKGVVDLGLQRAHPKGKLMAAIKGLVDAGLEVPHSAEAFPEDDKVLGNHIAQYAGSVADDKTKFASYKSAKIDVTKFNDAISKAKEQILALK